METQGFFELEGKFPPPGRPDPQNVLKWGIYWIDSPGYVPDSQSRPKHIADI
jgi:hypothetical protein